jgi:uncharacterized phage protein gp47/JayE
MVSGFYIRFLVQTSPYGPQPQANQAFLAPEPGIVNVYAHDAGGALSAPLKAAVEEAIGKYGMPEVNKYRGAGIRVNVYAPVSFTQNINVDVQLADGYIWTDIQAIVTATIADIFTNLVVGEPLIWTEMVQVIMNSSAGIVKIIINTPTNDVYSALNQLLVKGTVVVNQL